MAKRGSKKQRSVEQENVIANLYGGRRSPSSGAQAHDLGDVRTAVELIECKMTGSPETDMRRRLDGKEVQRSKIQQDFEKISDEAISAGLAPILALRFYAPESVHANSQGWVDLVVRTADDDSWRSELLRPEGPDCGEQGRWRSGSV